MIAYMITTFATEDRPQMTCAYPYSQWKELIAYFKKEKIRFSAFTIEA